MALLVSALFSGSASADVGLRLDQDSPVNSVALSADGQTLVAGGGGVLNNDYRLRVWKLSTRTIQHVLAGHKARIRGVDITADGKTAVSVGVDGLAIIWNLETGKLSRQFQLGDFGLYSVDLLNDGLRAVSNCGDHCILVWSCQDGKVIHRVQLGSKETAMPWTTSVSRDGKTALTGMSSGAVVLWDVESGSQLQVLKRFNHCVGAVALSPDGRRAAIEAGSEVRLLDVATGEILRTRNIGEVECLQFSVDGSRIVSGHGARNHKVCVWHGDTLKKLATYERHRGSVLSLAIASIGQKVYSASVDGTICCWAIPSQEKVVVRQFAGHRETTYDLAELSGSRRFLTAGGDGSILLWDLDESEPIRTLTRWPRPRRLASSLDGKHVAAMSSSRAGTRVRMWDCQTGEQEAQLLDVPGRAEAVALMSGEEHVLLGFDSGQIGEWDLESGKQTRDLRGHTSGVLDMRLSPDGSRLATSSSDGTARIWNLADGSALVLQHADEVNTVRFSPDGKQLLTGSGGYDHHNRDSSIKQWDVETGALIQSFHGHKLAVLALRFTPDGTRIISGSADRTLRVWDLSTGQPLRAINLQDGYITRVGVTPDGKFALAVSEDNSVRMLDLDLLPSADQVEAQGPELPTVQRTSRLALILKEAVRATYFRATGFYKKPPPEPEEALRAYDQMLSITPLAYADEPADAARWLELAGQGLRFNLRAYARADMAYNSALELAKANRNLFRNDEDIADLENRVAWTYVQLGRNWEASQHMSEALRLMETSYGPNDIDVANATAFAADHISRSGQIDRAELLFRELIETRPITELGGPDELEPLRNHLLRQGNGEAVIASLEALYRKSLRRFGPDSDYTLKDAQNLAQLYLGEQRYEDAIRLLQDCRAALQRQGSRAARQLANVELNLAWAYTATGDFDQAVELVSRERRAAREYIFRSLPLMSQVEQLQYLNAQEHWRFSQAMSLAFAARDNPRVVQAAAEWLLNFKGTGLESLASIMRQATESREPRVARLLGEVRVANDEMAKAVLRTPEPAERDAHRKRIARLKLHQRALSRQLTLAVLNEERIVPWIKLEQVRDCIPSEGILVDIIAVNIRDLKPAEREQASKDQPQSILKYLAFVIPATDQGVVGLVDLGPVETTSELVRSFRATIDNIGEQERAAENAIRNQLLPLSQAVFEPLRPHLSDAKQWLISPDYELWLFPWEALQLPNGEYAVQRHVVSYLVSPRAMLRQESVGEDVSSTPVIFANPDYDFAPPELQVDQGQVEVEEAGPGAVDLPQFRYLDGVEFNELPGTAAEADAIGPLIEKLTGEPPLVYTRADALERVAKVVASPKMLVFSTHGFYLPRYGLTSHPLLYTGLALTGANQGKSLAAAGLDDGVLLGEEISTMDLRSTDLVVLSACETGLGQLHHGEGVVGLRSAFHLAGAKATLSTLWPISDDATVSLQTDFFSNLADGQTTAVALRNAKIKMIQDRRETRGAAHPYFWAAFVLTGPGR